MRLLTFLAGSEMRLGAELGDKVVDLNAALVWMLEQSGELAANRLAQALLPADMLSFLQAGLRARQEGQRVLEYIDAVGSHSELPARFLFDRSNVQACAPIPRPGKVICVGVNYRNHVMEMKREIPTIPVIFAKLANTIVGPEAAVPMPRVSTDLDYEAELAVVIGRTGRYIKESEAYDYVAGYTAFNDISVRDWQRRTPQWLQGKSFDKTGPLGPVLVTVDEISDPHQLGIRSYVNGELRQNDNTDKMIFNVPFLVSFISQVMTLEPGDVIATGTPGGVGFAMDPPRFMKVGDTVRVEIDRIGSLENYIVADESV